MTQELAALIAAHGGPFTRRDALSCGYTAKAIRRILDSGRWTALGRGVYVESRLLEACAGDSSWRHAIDIAAAAVSLHTDAVGSHHSAARVHRMEMLRTPEGVSLTRPRGPGPTRPMSGEVRVRCARLPAGHVSERYGVGVTSPARTVVDLARTFPFRDGVVLADSALRATGISRADLVKIIDESSCAPGIRTAREVVAFADALAESVLESVSRVVFAEHGLPPPQRQVVLGEGERIGRVDFYWAEYGVVGEADGMIKYADQQALQAEKERQERLENAGFIVVRFTWDDVVRHPERTVTRIRRAFVRATRRG